MTHAEMKRCWEEARASGDYHALMRAIPYARTIGMVMSETDGELRFTLPFRQSNIGNVLLPALHGGVIGGFLENVAIFTLLASTETRSVPKVVDFSIDYLRSGRALDLYGRCDIVRQGKRVANVQLVAWQDDAAKPVASARAHFLLG
ncbi:PaaI family thioesterase [Chitiniphilus eburneus]|uniref:PaaI family thioesterase n=1 Tax=Chitiniphilus eburneus TaxID=2571148 RepID=A0A4U0PZX0_9NEIS|nr:PaaI family thioesterase [Chitiniphilus eburneus]TJZ73850.1 PaaI family thioesterase [Chitiniphilus eburneus]